MSEKYRELNVPMEKDLTPDEKLFRKFGKVGGQLIELHRDLYPTLVILAKKGREMSPHDIAEGVANAIRTYEAPESIDKPEPRGSAHWLWEKGEDFIEVIVSDEEKAAETKRIWRMIRHEPHPFIAP
jgi:hypothetical protein